MSRTFNEHMDYVTGKPAKGLVFASVALAVVTAGLLCVASQSVLEVLGVGRPFSDVLAGVVFFLAFGAAQAVGGRWWARWSTRAAARRRHELGLEP